ncbi:MAG: hypothetical protein CR986_09775 [Ignavibacteriae bacterium]|nr:MAG: hypothetical protein CR986_09775 [Ignavibacteriota bacterium]
MILNNKKYNFLIKQYKNRVYSYSIFLLKNRMDADDVTQEVLIKIWENIGEFKMLSAKTWIMKTTHNLCIDYLRKRKSDLCKNPFSIDDVSQFMVNKDEQNPAKELENKMTDVKIKNAIKLLSENQRSIFVLYQIQGMKYKEISKTLEIPINTVKVYLLRARKQLQEYLSKDKLQEVA